MLPACCSLHVAPFSHVSLVERQTGAPLTQLDLHDVQTCLKQAAILSCCSGALFEGFWATSPFGVDLSPLAFHVPCKHYDAEELFPKNVWVVVWHVVCRGAGPACLATSDRHSASGSGSLSCLKRKLLCLVTSVLSFGTRARRIEAGGSVSLWIWSWRCNQHSTVILAGAVSESTGPGRLHEAARATDTP